MALTVCLVGMRRFRGSSRRPGRAGVRSGQRQTQGLDTSARRMISAVPQPVAVARMIGARQTCCCGLFRSATIHSSPGRLTQPGDTVKASGEGRRTPGMAA